MAIRRIIRPLIYSIFVIYKLLLNKNIMSTLAWIGIIIQAIPVFFIIKTGVSMARQKSSDK